MTDNGKLEQKVQKLKKRYKKDGKYKTNRKWKWEEIYRKMPNVTDENEITMVNLKIAVQEYLNEMPVIDVVGKRQSLS